jgi:hypothetical protein
MMGIPEKQSFIHWVRQMKQGFFQMLARGLILFLVFPWASIVNADTLETTDVQVTDTSDYETCPSLGQDSTGEMVVYTSFAVDATGVGTGVIMVQRLNADGTTSGQVIQVSDGTSDDQLNDVSGSRIVFTAYDANTPLWGQIKLYDLDTGDTVDIMTEADTVREARIEGDIVVWTQGQTGDTRINYFDLNWPSGIEPLTIGGPVPASHNVDIGSRYVVWQESNGGSTDIGGYDIYGGDYVSIAADPDVNESDPATYGQLVVWQATHADGTTTIEIADFSVKPAARYTAVDNGTLVYAPSINSNVVAYEGKRNASADLDIFLHRISDKADFPLTAAAGDQYLNNIFGNKVGYVDASAGQTDIHVATFLFVSSQPPDACDNAGGDPDGDGVCQNSDNCGGIHNPDQTDTDLDGVGNVCDNCPLEANPFQVDSDKDTLGDACDACPDDAGPDPDRDAVCTSVDNCPFVANTDQNDADGDGVGDACAPEPDIEVSPSDYNFGDVELGFSTNTIVTISNVGGADLTVNNVGFQGGSCGDFSITGSTLVQPDQINESTTGTSYHCGGPGSLFQSFWIFYLGLGAAFPLRATTPLSIYGPQVRRAPCWERRLPLSRVQ